MYKNQVLYIFGPGRKSKIDENSVKASEFFYGFNFFKKKYTTEILEVNKDHSNKEGLRKFIHIYDRIIVKLTNFPSYSVELISKKNMKLLNSSKKIVYTSDALFLSLLPVLFLNKVIKRRNENFVITMGLFGKHSTNFLKSIFNFIYQRIFLYSADKFIFLGYGEYQFVKNNFSKYQSKFEYLPFCVDTKFWSMSKNQKKEGILFVGNDGKRDYNFLIKLSQHLPELNFTVITNQELNFNTSNVRYIKGNWSDQLISDESLREIYSKSKLTIIPIKNSYQPSGQSVALQSLSCNTPILITKTNGFFGDEDFIKEYKINFVHSNLATEWENELNKILNDYQKAQLDSKSFDNFIDNFDVAKFNLGLDKILFGS